MSGFFTSENLARFIYQRLATAVNSERYCIQRVNVHETPDACAAYWE